MTMQLSEGVTSDFQSLSTQLGYFHGNRFAHYGDYRIISAFQPIYSIAHRRIVGLEGLARGLDATDALVSPEQMFGQASSITALDRICQLVHIDNFHALDPPSAWLFLNVDPTTLSNRDDYIRFLSAMLRDKAYSAERLVIEILESTIADEQALEIHIQTYREMGFLIAIDDFGAGQSNFERIWRIKPDIVKLDRSMVKKAGTDPSVRHLLKGITSMLHNCKCIVLAEGIETEQEAIAVMDAQIDLVQGYYFARPFLLSEPINTSQGLWKNLYNRFDELSLLSQRERDAFLAPYLDYFSQATVGASVKPEIGALAERMFSLERTVRLYQLALDGSQCFSNVNSPRLSLPSNDRLRALADTNGASWKRRDYFASAMNSPGRIQITGPYFSISDATLCMTLSIRTETVDGEFVLCCDILCED